MRPSGPAAELFAAFSRISARFFRKDRLLSCPNLSKAPNYGQVLRKYLLQSPHQPLRPLGLLRAGLRYLLANSAHLAFLILGAVYIRLLGWKLPEQTLLNQDQPLLLIDTFAVLPKIESDEAFHDLYLPGLYEEARKRGHGVALLYRLYGSRNPRTLWRAFKVLAARGDCITEAHLFRPADWLRLFWHCLSYPFALFGLIRYLRAFPERSPERYIHEALVRTAGQCVLIGEARRIAGYRLGLLLSARPFVCAEAGPDSPKNGQGRRATLIASWYENQTVNKCLIRGLRQAENKTGRHISVLGAQLMLWPQALLNNHPDDAEAALGLAPDRVLVNGPYYLPENSSQDYAVGPSLRYGEVFSDMGKVPSASGQPRENQAPAPQKKLPPVLALLSYHPEEIRRVLEMLLPLAEKGAEIIYKFHPATNPEQFGAWLPMKPELARGSLKSSFQSIFYKKGIVLGSGSGALAEAVVTGIPVLAVEDPVSGLGLNYLPEYGKGQLWESVSSAGDVELALRVLDAALADPERTQKLRAFRDMLFTEPTGERIRRDFGL